MAILSFQLSSNLFLRDPQNTELGQNIIKKSIELIDEIGFEDFTFRKLAESIHSTEASVYRYFENKHRLLIYLIDWYWTWLDYKMEFGIQNISEPFERLKTCLQILIEMKTYDHSFAFVDQAALQRIVMAEFDKTYLTKQVDGDNKEGLFLPFKAVCKRMSDIITELNPSYKHPHTLISTILLTSNHQLFYAMHLPSLTDIKCKEEDHVQELYNFCEAVILNAIKI